MKTLFYMLFVFLAGCSTNKPVTFSFGSDFKLTFPAEQIAGSTIFYSDELSIKTDKGAVFSGRVLSREDDALPENFEMGDYPKYILKIKPIGEAQPYYDKFIQSSNEIDHVYGLENTTIDESENWTIYSLCRDRACLAFVVKMYVEEYILTVHAANVDGQEFLRMIRGALNAKS